MQRIQRFWKLLEIKKLIITSLQQLLIQMNHELQIFIIIYCIQKYFKKRQCNLKISWMVIGYDINFESMFSDLKKFEIIKNDFNVSNNDQAMINTKLFIKTVPPCVGIPVLNKLDSPKDYSTIIGHYFFNTQKDRIELCTFSFCLKTNRYVNLPSFTFYTLVSNAYETIPFKFHTLQFWNKRLFIDLKESTSQSDNSDPKYISLYQ